MKKAFTLVEMMIAVTIIIILVTLAVPNILRSRIVANEGAALANLKTISNACQLYHINTEAYPESLSALTTSNPPYIDSVLATGRKQGYEFTYILVDLGHFTINANPLPGPLKGRYFYTDESGVISVKSGSAAGPDDEVIG